MDTVILWTILWASYSGDVNHHGISAPYGRRPTIRLVEFVDQGCSRGDLQSRDHVIRDAFNPRRSIRIALGKVIDTNGNMGL